jgi:hypothetical protein
MATLKESLKDLLDEKISDPIEYNRRIAAAFILIADKLDADTGVRDTDYGEYVNDEIATKIKK